VRLILGISFLLLGFGTFLCQVEGLNARSVPPHAAWVRTTDGWERYGSWQIDSVSPPPIHPLVVAAGQGLVSLFVLVAFHPGGKAQNSQP
jgi:hypothetical protein